MKKTINRIAVAMVAVAVLAVSLCGGIIPVMAASSGLTVSPMNEKIILNPGETYQSSFKISNPVDSQDTLNYELSVEPFYMKNGGDVVFEVSEIESEHTQITDWIKFDVSTKGKLEPNEVADVLFTVNVPKNAAAGGQYAMIAVTTVDETDDSGSSSKGRGSSTTVNEIKRLGHLIYAEVTGNTIRQGEITDLNVPSFLLSGNITGSATVKNTGNVHGEAKYSLQVFPLFSGEEVFTNEEKPGTRTVLPNRDYYAEVTWEDTPEVGFYNVVFKVEFEGETQEIKKMVIKMPIWLLFLIIFIICAIVIWIVFRVREKGKKKSRKSGNTAASTDAVSE